MTDTLRTKPGHLLTVPIGMEADLIRVRQVLRLEAGKIGMGLVDVTKLVTAGSELARNILVYAAGEGGEMVVERVGKAGQEGIRATFSDKGPGIDDIDAALTDGFSTSGSLGLGLPGARRLVDEMQLSSNRGEGTIVVVTKWKR